MILHLFKTDVRRARVLLAIWLLLVLLECTLVGSGFHPANRMLEAVYQAASQLIPVLQILVLVVMIPFIVQEEPLVGTTAFWFTRPIWRHDLLRAKTLFAAMLITLPVFTAVVVLTAVGATGHDIAWAAPELILAQLGSIITFAVLASLTPNFARFAIVGAILLVASMLWSLGKFGLQSVLNPDAVFSTQQNTSLLTSRGLVGDLASVVGLGAVIVHQYLTRKTQRSIAGAGLVVTGTLIISFFWPWDLFAARPLPDFGTDASFSKIELSLGQTQTRDVRPLRGASLPRKEFVGEITLVGLPVNYEVTPRETKPHVSVAGGRSFEVEKPALDYFGSASFSSIEALESALNGTPIVNVFETSHRYAPTTGLFTVDADAYSQQTGQQFDLTCDFDFVVSKYFVIAEIPLVRDAQFKRGSERTVITDVLRQGDGVEIVLRQRLVSLLFTRASESIKSSFATQETSDAVFVLRNKKRNEAVRVRHSFAGGVTYESYETNSIGSSNTAKSQVLSQRTIRLPFGPEQGLITPPLTADWLADATLVCLQLKPVGKFNRQLMARNLKINGRNEPDFRQIGVDPSLFKNVSLAENASKAQVKSYIRSILALSRRQNSFNSEDLQVALLRKVGPQNLDVLIDTSRDREGSPFDVALWYIDFAIQELARPDDKDLILQALTAHPDLVDTVTHMGWQSDARVTFLAALHDTKITSVPSGWIQALAALKDPITYPDLKAYLVRGPNKASTFAAIRDLPGLELSDAVETIWKNTKIGSPDQVIDGAMVAAASGRIEGLDRIFAVLKQDDGSFNIQYWLKNLVPFDGDNAAFIAWFQANRDHLAFDPEKKKFVLRSP